MKKLLKKGKSGNRKERLVGYEKMKSLNENSTRIELIQMLIPVGLQAIEEELQSEVSNLAGSRLISNKLDSEENFYFIRKLSINWYQELVSLNFDVI